MSDIIYETQRGTDITVEYLEVANKRMVTLAEITLTEKGGCHQTRIEIEMAYGTRIIQKGGGCD